MTMPPAPAVKAYPKQHNTQQYRLEKAVTFTCSRCCGEKTAKLIATTDGKWDKPICNGCYGKILSEG